VQGSESAEVVIKWVVLCLFCLSLVANYYRYSTALILRLAAVGGGKFPSPPKNFEDLSDDDRLSEIIWRELAGGQDDERTRRKVDNGEGR
jgi:hypothetical protein